jgi:hypothetical protein
VSSSAWLTPDNLPAVNNCWRVLVPDSIEFEAAFRGALLLLQQEWNWEKYGDQTPEDCALLWQELNAQSFSMVPCLTGGIMLPVGAIIWFASTSAPTHCWPCDGASHLAIHAPELFSLIGYTFGGSMDHFNVPDLRRRFIRGYDVTPPQVAFGVTSVNDFTSGQNGWLALAPYIVYESV